MLGFVFKVLVVVFASSTGLCWDLILICFFLRVRRLLVCEAVVDEVVDRMLVESVLCLLKTCLTGRKTLTYLLLKTCNNNNNNENNVPGMCRV